MYLYFLRHGEAEPYVQSDFDRELTIEGINAATIVGKALCKMKIPFSSALVSPLVRAQQTLRFVSEQLHTFPQETHEHLTPGSDPRTLFSELKHFSGDSHLLLITHEPFASTAISNLISGTNESRVIMKTTNLCCVEVGSIIQKAAGKLLWLLTPEQMKLMIQT